MTLYAFLCLVTVTINLSTKSPTPFNPHNYGLSGCTGVFISPNEILTAGHCMEGSRGRQWAKTNEGVSYSLTVEKIDKHRDLALLKIDKPIKHAFVSLGLPAKRLDEVFTVNSGGRFEHTYNTGIVNNIINDEDTSVLTVMHNAAILPGASGSGLFNSEGELVGINTYTIKSFSGAVDLYEILCFLNYR